MCTFHQFVNLKNKPIKSFKLIFVTLSKSMFLTYAVKFGQTYFYCTQNRFYK